MPTMALYDGKVDPNEHIVTFKDHIYLFNLDNNQGCKVFVILLTKATKR